MVLASSLNFNSTKENPRTAIMFKVLVIYVLLMHLAFIFLFYYSNFSSTTLKAQNDLQTNTSHLVFGIFASAKGLHRRKVYIESWWRPNKTRGYVFLDEAPKNDDLPSRSPSSPPYRVSDKLHKSFLGLPGWKRAAFRIVHWVMEVIREVNEDFRWVVIGDDDTIFLVDNLVNVLKEYDHTKYYYLGGPSESVLANFGLSFDQGFGGAGIILSYPLAMALAKNIDNCLFQYSNLNASDIIIMKCIADIGVSLCPHKGLHQIDFKGDLSGFLSAHPQAPLISLHHFDKVTPIFPSKNRYESTLHLMKAASFDQSRMMQQTICYHRQIKWSFSIAWGYSVQLYETILPRSLLQIPIETFKPWLKPRPLPPHYMFNTRRVFNNSCEAPHEFFLESVEETSTGAIRAVYLRAYPRGIPACSLHGNYSADYVSRIEVFSPITKPVETGKCECCDIVNQGAITKTVKLKFRHCREVSSLLELVECKMIYQSYYFNFESLLEPQHQGPSQIEQSQSLSDALIDFESSNINGSIAWILYLVVRFIFTN